MTRDELIKNDPSMGFSNLSGRGGRIQRMWEKSLKEMSDRGIIYRWSHGLYSLRLDVNDVWHGSIDHKKLEEDKKLTDLPYIDSFDFTILEDMMKETKSDEEWARYYEIREQTKRKDRMKILKGKKRKV